MALNAAYVCTLFVALATSPLVRASDGSSDMTANPIRRVVSLLQNMAKKIEAEGKKEQEIYDKYMCYCKTSSETLGDSIAGNDAKVPQVQSDIEEAVSQLATTKAELTQHQVDRDAAKVAMQKATAIREKEHADYLKESGETKTTINALAKAIPAIESGMAGNGFLQTSAAELIRRVAFSDVDLTDFDRDALSSFLQGKSTGSESYVPKSGQIVGILKQMKSDFDNDLKALETQEESAQKTYDELMAAKTKEVASHTEAIERKTGEVGELSVSIVNMKNDLSDAEAALVDDKKFLADMEKNCATKKSEWDDICKNRADELLAISETITILNSDDALDLFKKTLPSPSLLQIRANFEQARQQALQVVKEARQLRKADPQVDLIALALSGKKVDFSKVLKMIDDMVALLAKEQTDDDNKKEYCTGQLDTTEDKVKALNHAIEDLDTKIADTEEFLKTVKEDLKNLGDGIEALDKQVVDATFQRKQENQEYTELLAQDNAAKQLIEFAKNRMQKFYNPKLYKPPAKRELESQEEEGGRWHQNLIKEDAMFLQVSSVRRKDAPPPPPEAVGAYKKKGEENGGVLAMMDLLIRDLDKEITEAQVEEKNAQAEYEELMDDAAMKRAEMSKDITDKESAKATTEEDHTTDLDARKESAEELGATQEYAVQLHKECDWLLQNYDLRKTARADERDALNKAKAVLSGANFSLMQKVVAFHKF